MNHVRSSLAIEQENKPILLGDYLYSHAYHLHFWRLKSPLLPPITFSSVAREAVALGLVATPATASRGEWRWLRWHQDNPFRWLNPTPDMKHYLNGSKYV